MLRIAWKSLLAHRLRVALTALAVVLGVSFVAGSFVLTDSIDDAFTGLFDEIGAGTDVYVNPPGRIDEDVTTGGWTSTAEPLPAPVADEVAAVDGVAEVWGSVEGPAQLIAPDGDAIGGQGPPTLGFSWDERGPLYLRDGRTPQGPGEVVIDAASASGNDIAVGTGIRVVTPAGSEPFEVVGIVGFGESDNLLGATLAAFELEEARRLFGKPDAFDSIVVSAEPGLDATTLRDRVAAALGDRAEVVTVHDANEADLAGIRSFLSIINGVLLGFAFVAMFVAAFLIANTYSVVVAQRTREFALLRAVGASRRQVTATVVIEALLLGLVASAVGLALGVGFAAGLRSLLDAFGFGMPSSSLPVEPRTALWAFVVGTGVTVVASLHPARRAGRLAPVEALTGAATPGGSVRARVAWGAVVGAAGVVLLAVGLVLRPGGAPWMVGGGGVAVLLAVALASPLLARPVAGLVGAAPAALGVPGRMARGNAARDTRRTGTTASALMVGMALISLGVVFASSVNATVADTLERQFRADLVLTVSQPTAIGIPPEVARSLERIPEVGVVSPVRHGTFVVDGDSRTLAAVDPATVDRVLALDVTSGEIASLDRDQVFVSDDVAESQGLAPGDRIVGTFPLVEERALDVAGTYDATELLGAAYLVSHVTYRELFRPGLDSTVFLEMAEGVAPADVRTAVEATMAVFPNVSISDATELRAEAEASVDQVLGLIAALLALAVIVALIGIANTLTLATYERTREIGLLRAVGMTRGQVRAMVRWEAVIVSVLGAALGVAVGMAFGWAIVRSLSEEGFDRLVVPGGQLLAYALVAVAAGFVAALLPARRAARMDVLAAVTHE